MEFKPSQVFVFPMTLSYFSENIREEARKQMKGGHQLLEFEEVVTIKVYNINPCDLCWSLAKHRQSFRAN